MSLRKPLFGHEFFLSLAITKLSQLICISLLLGSAVNHSHKKRKESLETLGVLLIFLFELEISAVAVQRIHQDNEKLWLL